MIPESSQHPRYSQQTIYSDTPDTRHTGDTCNTCFSFTCIDYITGKDAPPSQTNSTRELSAVCLWGTVTGSVSQALKTPCERGFNCCLSPCSSKQIPAGVTTLAYLACTIPSRCALCHSGCRVGREEQQLVVCQNSLKCLVNLFLSSSTPSCLNNGGRHCPLPKTKLISVG